MKITLKQSSQSNSEKVLATESLQTLLSLLLMLPHGVAKMSHAVQGMSFSVDKCIYITVYLIIYSTVPIGRTLSAPKRCFTKRKIHIIEKLFVRKCHLAPDTMFT